MLPTRIILYLCATDATAGLRPPKLHPVVQQLYTPSPSAISFVNYFNGAYLTHSEPFRCRVNLKEDFVTQCGYMPEQFDAVVSEYCPITESPSLFMNNEFLGRIYTILKPDGCFLLQVNHTDSLSEGITQIQRTKITTTCRNGTVETLAALTPKWLEFFVSQGFQLEGCIPYEKRIIKDENGKEVLKENAFYVLRKVMRRQGGKRKAI